MSNLEVELTRPEGTRVTVYTIGSGERRRLAVRDKRGLVRVTSAMPVGNQLLLMTELGDISVPVSFILSMHNPFGLDALAVKGATTVRVTIEQPDEDGAR